MDGEAITRHNVLERMLLDDSAEPTNLKLSLLEAITKDFSDELQIGRGGFAVVYKGMLGNGTVAVKKLNETLDIDEKQFNREVESLIGAKHKNVVRFLGYCSDTQGKHEKYNEMFVMADVRHRLLCFKYLPKGSLDEYITDASHGLEWKVRYQIIKGICEGLHYLHQKGIIHLDLKPANILLDDGMVPKIADFGLSRCFDKKQSWTITSKLIGSLGYMAPEFFNGRISVKLDIYSLGVIILEILTGEKGFSAVEEVVKSWMNRLEICEGGTVPLEQVRVCAEIGTDCMNSDPTKRPVTRHIIERLDKMGNMDWSVETGMSNSSATQAENASNEQHKGTPNVREETSSEAAKASSEPQSVSAYKGPEDKTTEMCSSSASKKLIMVDPHELHFPLEQKRRVSSPLQLINVTDDFVAFTIRLRALSTASYFLKHRKGIMPPHCTRKLNVRREAHEGASADMQFSDEIFVLSTLVSSDLKPTDISDDMFNKQPGRIVHEVKLGVDLVEPSPPQKRLLQNTTIMEPKRLVLRLLEEITDNFSEEREIGQGAYGRVYRGERKNGEEIAVKMFHNDRPGLDAKQFQNEFHNLMRLEHPNIVRLVGYCYETQRILAEYNGKIVFARKKYRALCLEYLCSGSLENHLSDEFHGLDWHTRYKIIKGTCEGLKYMHEGFKEPIYHLDLKPGNILLDKNMVPKLADFGLSKLFGEEQTRITQSPVGTIGYLPPEYIEKNVISKKLDIFSLGVVMIKIIAGTRGRSTSAEMPPQEFIDLVQGNWKIRLQATCSGCSLETYSQQVKACTEIALNCVEIDRHRRPNIVDIISKLNEMETVIDKATASSHAGTNPTDMNNNGNDMDSDDDNEDYSFLYEDGGFDDMDEDGCYDDMGGDDGSDDNNGGWWQ